MASGGEAQKPPTRFCGSGFGSAEVEKKEKETEKEEDKSDTDVEWGGLLKATGARAEDTGRVNALSALGASAKKKAKLSN